MNFDKDIFKKLNFQSSPLCQPALSDIIPQPRMILKPVSRPFGLMYLLRQIFALYFIAVAILLHFLSYKSKKVFCFNVFSVYSAFSAVKKLFVNNPGYINFFKWIQTLPDHTFREKYNILSSRNSLPEHQLPVQANL